MIVATTLSAMVILVPRHAVRNLGSSRHCRVDGAILAEILLGVVAAAGTVWAWPTIAAGADFRSQERRARGRALLAEKNRTGNRPRMRPDGGNCGRISEEAEPAAGRNAAERAHRPENVPPANGVNCCLMKHVRKTRQVREPPRGDFARKSSGGGRRFVTVWPHRRRGWCNVFAQDFHRVWRVAL